MFEKSLYDLIRGLRNHKGNERSYIQDSIRECRREIKTQDLDLKATALLKLTYLEMFGHDMSWASFNVLEVMSSQKYPQKRVGYLAAVQSFRQDTEVLMLAENQLKKDLSSTSPPTISLPLVAIPHLLSAPMANSLLSDLLPRLSHSHPLIRKKTIVTLYRLALVYPETLRPAWPKLKERLLDESEESSVTASAVNVVCELGWRRPQDFLPLAPRLFDLLTESNNNWMAIKIVKLFATLTPIEPRLVKKLLPPLTTIIKTTPAMSLLYECINGIISGGILTSASGSTEGDDIARLCVSKLRGMLSVEGDPNLRYVALLAFNRIVELHPYLVSLQEDVILECIDDADISIRLRALDLATGMVNAQNLTSIIDRLLQQLEKSPLVRPVDDVLNDRAAGNEPEPIADEEDDDLTRTVRPAESESTEPSTEPSALSDEYRINIIRKVLQMCSQNTYAYVNDFEWYIDCLTILTRHIPYGGETSTLAGNSTRVSLWADDASDVAEDVGSELRDVAIRVKSSRGQAVRAAETLISTSKKSQITSYRVGRPRSVLGPCAWLVGEFPICLRDAHNCLDSIIRMDVLRLPFRMLHTFVHTSAKLCASIISNQQQQWTPERKTMISLLLSKEISFLEPLATHPDLEVQETAIQFLELMRLASEAASAHSPSLTNGDIIEAPLLHTQAIPSLFSGADLKPVAKDAQEKVPVPEELNLDEPINPYLEALLNVADQAQPVEEDSEFHDYYYKRPELVRYDPEPAADRLPVEDEPLSYQQSGAQYLDSSLAAKKRAERQAYLRNDPFYISDQGRSGRATPVHDILRSSNGDELDVDSIPIMALDLGDEAASQQYLDQLKASSEPKVVPPRNFEILGDETIDRESMDTRRPNQNNKPSESSAVTGANKSLLQIDSAGLRTLSLSDSGSKAQRNSHLDIERQEAEEAEMAQAMKEVERLRLEMQRAQDRIQSKQETTVIKKKKKKNAEPSKIPDRYPRLGDEDNVGFESDAERANPSETIQHTKPKKKKKKAKVAATDLVEGDEAEVLVKPKRKRKRKEVILEDTNA